MAEIDCMSQEEYSGWVEYYSIEPFGLAVTDAVQANIAALLANIHRDPKQRREGFALQDFMMFERRNANQEAEPALLDDPEEQSNLLMNLFMSMQPTA